MTRNKNLRVVARISQTVAQNTSGSRMECQFRLFDGDKGNLFTIS